jgi:hypothetical protein
MTVLSRSLVELVLLGPTNDRRQLQDTPILGDVWIAFADRPAAPMDLLITPDRGQPAGPVAVRIADRIRKMKMSREKGEEAHVAYLEGLIAARLFFREVLRVIVPMTKWWRERDIQNKLRAFTEKDLCRRIDAVIRWAQAADEAARAELAADLARFKALDRYVALAGIILWAGKPDSRTTAQGGGIGDLIKGIESPDAVSQALLQLFKEIERDRLPREAQVFQVSLNRSAIPAVERSVPSVKADAARTLFKVKCESIQWAVLDSGIDDTHPAFRDESGASRIVRAYDFGNIREIVSLDNLYAKTAEFKRRVRELRAGLRQALSERDTAAILIKLAEDADNDRPIDWGSVERLIDIKPNTPTKAGHGTHVAGIIGANASAAQRKARGGRSAGAGAVSDSKIADGMCPDIKLYDFRVLGKSITDTEFAIIAALQFIRYLNERHSYMSIHGVNLSLSIPHDVRNFACGRTPVCVECERLVESGVVVVAAAGNLGYQRFETKEGLYEGYTAFSITDPGNADGVITVGATHRYRPHTYGVSFFSSRGPTGDGRLKPDLVAPGERIESSLPDGEWGELDGTSMAAPHVSGAAAMLMGRYAELVGEPRRIKQILCESATDLGRERSFQGHGMLDVLRAFQRI